MTAEEKRKRHAEAEKQRRANNRAKMRLYDRLRYQANDKRKTTSRERYRKHRKELAEKKRKYRAENCEHVSIVVKEWRERNPDKLKVYYERDRKRWCKRAALRRARKRNATVGNMDLVTKWEKSLKQKRFAKCYWCGKRISSKKIHLDHIVPLSRGGSHSIDNLVVACPKCNLKKHAQHPSKWNLELTQKLLVTV